MSKKLNMLLTSAVVAGAVLTSWGQIAGAGPYSLLQTVVSNGGGVTANGPFDINSTIGQSIAGDGTRVAAFSIQSGFWQRGSILTAAGVSISGRVTTSAGGGLRNAVVQVTDSHGVTRTVLTGAFGYYSFENVLSGQTYVVSVASKRYQFAPRVVGLVDNLSDLDFEALP